MENDINNSNTMLPKEGTENILPDKVIDQFLISKQFRLAPMTLKKYRFILNGIFTSCSKTYDKVEKSDIEEWVIKMQESGLTPATMRSKLLVLRSFYQYCLEEELVVKDPTVGVRVPRVPFRIPKIPDILNEDQLFRLRELVKNSPRERAIVETIYSTGVRTGELVDIKLADIHFGEQSIFISKVYSNRIVLITSQCELVLKDYLALRNNDSPYLFCNNFGGKLSARNLQAYFVKWSNDLGFSVTGSILRSTLIDHMIKGGMHPHEIANLLGYRNINTIFKLQLY